MSRLREIVGRGAEVPDLEFRATLLSFRMVLVEMAFERSRKGVSVIDVGAVEGRPAKAQYPEDTGRLFCRVCGNARSKFVDVHGIRVVLLERPRIGHAFAVRVR